jgi:ribonuclease VapC
MVIDTSALVAILAAEPVAPRLLAAIEADPVRYLSAATLVEATLVVVGRYGPDGRPRLDALVRAMRADVRDVDARQVDIAREAALRFGKGRHPAALNFGDLFAYALAVSSDQPLLCTGDDFPRTDVDRVAW